MTLRHLLLAAAIAALLGTGACAYRIHGQAGRPAYAQDAWKKPDAYWNAWLKKKPLAAPTVGRTYYASPTGSDDDSGELSHPWRTLQRAAIAMGPGDTLLIDDGEYPGGLSHRTSGEPGKPITYRAVNAGKAIIRGDQVGPDHVIRRVGTQRVRTTDPNPAPARDGLTITLADHVVVEGLVVHHAPRAGLRVDRSNNVSVRYCRFSQNGVWGLFTNYSDDLLLERNECAYNGAEHGIYVSNSGDRPVVSFNTCHDNGRSGIQLNGDAKLRRPELGTRYDGIIDGPVLEGNVIYTNGWNGAAGFNLACVHNGRFVNNLMYDNKAGGIALSNDHRRDMTAFGCKNNRILHNTILFQPGEGRYCIVLKHGSTGNIIRGNILAGGRRGAYEFDGTASFTADNNVLWSLGYSQVAINEDTGETWNIAAWKKLGKHDANSVWADPRLGKDFRPLPGSPALGKAATEAGALTDLTEKLRGPKRSIGALEAGK